MPTQVILLERVEHLGAMGDVVKVKPGYARNFLLPQQKALRATKENIAHFETRKAELEKINGEKVKDAQGRSKKLDGLKVSIIRQASEGGQLYGSVTSRDIAEAVTAESKEQIERGMVQLNQNFKSIGLFPVTIALHPEVKVVVTINIARSADEAKAQAKSGKALIASEAAKAEPAISDDAKSELMDEQALEAEKEYEAENAAKEAEKAEKAAKKAETKSAKKATKKTDESDEEAPEAEAKAEAAEEDSE